MVLKILFKNKEIHEFHVAWVSNTSTKFGTEKDRILYIPFGMTNDIRNRKVIPMSDVLCWEICEN